MKKTNRKNNAAKTDSTVEVLYQRMGESWYAFSLVGDDVFFGKVDASEVKQNQANSNDGINLNEYADFETLLNHELSKENSAA